MSDRELTDVKLPSGKIAKIVTYFTRGESNEISRLSWENASAEQQPDGSVKILNIPVNQGKLQEDATVLMGVKFIGDDATNKETIDNLPVEDFNVLILELNKVIAGKKKTS